MRTRNREMKNENKTQLMNPSPISEPFQLSVLFPFFQFPVLRARSPLPALVTVSSVEPKSCEEHSEKQQRRISEEKLDLGVDQDHLIQNEAFN